MNNHRETWIINGLLAVILALLVGFYVNRGVPSAAAAVGGDAVMAMSTSGPADHLVLVDTNNQNIMVYQVRGKGNFGLIGARSYKYDVEMEDTTYVNQITNVGITFAEAYQMYEANRKALKP